MEEQYVTFETAELLRELGYKGKCHADYHVHNNGDIEFETCDWLMSYDDDIPTNIYLAPTVGEVEEFLKTVD